MGLEAVADHFDTDLLRSLACTTSLGGGIRASRFLGARVAYGGHGNHYREQPSYMGRVARIAGTVCGLWPEPDRRSTSPDLRRGIRRGYNRYLRFCFSGWGFSIT